MLELAQSYFGLSADAVRDAVWQEVERLTATLASKGISYGELKSVLVPRKDRCESAFCFDSLRTASDWYGHTVHSQLLPLLARASNHSVLHGDILSHGVTSSQLLALLDAHLTRSGNPIELAQSGQVYCVYLNNLTKPMCQAIHEGLRGYTPYLGYLDLTFNSSLKWHLSGTLVSGFIKHGRTIIQPHEADHDDSHDQNTLGFPFEDRGWVCRSVSDDLYGILLSYKIERPVISGAEKDAYFNLASISSTPSDLKHCQVTMTDDKFDYVRTGHGGSLKRIGGAELAKADLEQALTEKLRSNYIYSMSFSEQYDVAKFNMILELEAPDTGEPFRMLGAFEYEAGGEMARLITLY